MLGSQLPLGQLGNSQKKKKENLKSKFKSNIQNMDVCTVGRD